MAQVGPASMASARPVEAMRASFIDWGAILAGALTAAALSFVFLTFGAAIGLSVVSPWPSSGVSARTFSALAVFWTLVQQIGAFLAGGYIAGRMRAGWAELNADEVEFRDGLHGALVWALGICIGAALLLATAGAATRAATDLTSKAMSIAGLNTDPLAYYRSLLRGTRPAAGGGVAQTPARVEPVAPETRAETPRCCPFHRQRPLSDPDRATWRRSSPSAAGCRRPRRRSASPTPTPRPIASSGKPPTRHVAPRCWAASSPASA